jgi:hypothetical protein
MRQPNDGFYGLELINACDRAQGADLRSEVDMVRGAAVQGDSSSKSRLAGYAKTSIQVQ